MGLNKTALAEVLDALRKDDPSRTLDYHSWVLPKSRALCVTVPKVACSRVKATLHLLEGGQESEHIGIHDQGQRLVSFMTSEMVEILTSPQWFRFCFVRNPYERLLSAYKTQIANTWNDEYLWLKDSIKSKFGYPESHSEGGPELLVAFRDLVWYLRDGKDKVATYDGHFNVQSRILRLDFIHYDFIGRFESFQADFATALRRISAPDDITKTVDEVVNQTYRLHPAIAYDRELADAVYEIYEEDFTNFDYDRHSWMYESRYHESRMTLLKDQ